jgi:hypothetical protein
MRISEHQCPSCTKNCGSDSGCSECDRCLYEDLPPDTGVCKDCMDGLVCNFIIKPFIEKGTRDSKDNTIVYLQQSLQVSRDRIEQLEAEVKFLKSVINKF